jgi:hypothetical protein
MALNSRIRVLLAKLESTYNTDASPTGSDAVLVENPQLSYTGTRMIEQPVVKNTLGPKKQVYGGSLWQVTFDVKIKGSGTAGTAPEFGPLLQACMLSETIVASTSVTYTPHSDTSAANNESVTLYYYTNGKLHKLTGCRGTFTFVAEAGGAATLSFTMTGHDAGDSDASLPTPTYDSTVPPAVLSAGFSIDSFSAVINALNFDAGNTVSMLPSINAADSYGDIIITDRDVTGSFDPEDELLATEDFVANWETSKAMALTTGTIGSAGNQWQLSMPAVSYREVSHADREQIATLELTFGAHEDSGDDQFSLAFT